MSSTMHFSVEYVLVTCGADGCDQHFGMSRDFYDETQRKGIGWYCPRGHSRRWTGKTTEQQLLDAGARETALADQLGAAVREAEAARFALIRDRHRFANGVCPCCNRSFENVRRHMSTQHPDYDVTKVAQHAAAVSYRCSCGRSFDTPRGLRTHQTYQRRPGWEAKTSAWSQHLTKV